MSVKYPAPCSAGALIGLAESKCRHALEIPRSQKFKLSASSTASGNDDSVSRRLSQTHLSESLWDWWFSLCVVVPLAIQPLSCTIGMGTRLDTHKIWKIIGTCTISVQRVQLRKTTHTHTHTHTHTVDVLSMDPYGKMGRPKIYFFGKNFTCKVYHLIHKATRGSLYSKACS